MNIPFYINFTKIIIRKKGVNFDSIEVNVKQLNSKFKFVLILYFWYESHDHLLCM